MFVIKKQNVMNAKGHEQAPLLYEWDWLITYVSELLSRHHDLLTMGVSTLARRKSNILYSPHLLLSWA